MGDLFRLMWCLAAGLLRSQAALYAEILVLRHQLNVLQRKSPIHNASVQRSEAVRAHKKSRLGSFESGHRSLMVRPAPA